jgi:hypothetical protein
MLGERLATNHAMIGQEPTGLLPDYLGPLTQLERQARSALGEDLWRYWVGRGWAAVYWGN